MQNSLVEEGRMVKFPVVPLPLISFPCISCCKVLFAMRKLNNNIVQTQKDPASCILCQIFFKPWGQLCVLPIIKHMQKLWKCLLERRKPPKAQDHLPLAALPCLSAQCNHCGKYFSRNSTQSKLMLVIHGACHPSKILHERYLVQFISALPSASLPSRQGSASSST